MSSLLCMSLALLFLFRILILIAVIPILFDFGWTFSDLTPLFAFHHGQFLDKAYPTPAEGTCTVEVAFTQDRCFFTHEVSAARSSDEAKHPSFQRSTFDQNNYQDHVSYEQSSMEMPKLSTALQKLHGFLPSLSDALAGSDRSELCPWSETATRTARTATAELGWISWRTISTRASGCTKSEVSSAQKSKAEVASQSSRRQRCRFWTLRSIAALSTVPVSGSWISCWTSCATANHSATVDASECSYERTCFGNGAHAGCDACACGSRDKSIYSVSGFWHTTPFDCSECPGCYSSRIACVSTKEVCRSPIRCSAANSEALTQAKQESHQGSAGSCLGAWRSQNHLRGGATGSYAAPQHVEIFFGRSSQKLVRVCEDLRAAREGLAGAHLCCQRTISGSQAMPRCLQAMYRKSATRKICPETAAHQLCRSPRASSRFPRPGNSFPKKPNPSRSRSMLRNVHVSKTPQALLPKLRLSSRPTAYDLMV